MGAVCNDSLQSPIIIFVPFLVVEVPIEIFVVVFRVESVKQILHSSRMN